MDKFEYNLKLDQIKSLSAEGKYQEAAELADSINWNKIKNVNALVKVGEVYEQVGRYEDSKDIFLQAYDHSPIGRTIIYRLAEVAIKMKDFEAAAEYYNEFVEIAPHDNQRYVLKYNISKAKEAPYAEQIAILEEFKEQEYTEEWAYELAYLYHKAGKVEACVDACDELILWFGDGPYVEQALELKMLYQPLSKIQEEKYRTFRHIKEGKTVIDKFTMERAGEYGHDAVAIPPVTLNTSKYNTVNLQQEIAKGMEQIMTATEKETVVGTIGNIKKIVEEIPYLQIPKAEASVADKEDIHIETDEEIDGSLKINFKELLGEDSDGQMSLVVNERAALEKQITGQMSIAEVLEEWEKTKKAAEVALQEAEYRKLESAKARALQEAEDIMDRLTDVLPKIEAGVTPKELLEEQYMQDIPQLEEELKADLEVDEVEEDILDLEEEAKEDVPDLEEEVEEDIFDLEEEAKEDILDLEEETKEDVPNLEEEVEEDIFDLEEETKTGALEGVINFEEELEQDLASAEGIADLEQKENQIESETVIQNLSDEQKAVFSYFVPVRGMEAQICTALTEIIKHLNTDSYASRGNLAIQGSVGSGKTVLATCIIKVLQRETGKLSGKIGKINAEGLNKRDINQLLRAVAGGCLIIEKAGELDRTAAVTLSLLLEQDHSGTLLILEDSAAGIKRAKALDEGFAKKFTETISLPLFTNDDLVTFGRSYAKELGYVIDEMAVLALHDRINKIQKFDQATKLEEIKDIIDDAIETEKKSGLRKAWGIFTANRYTDDEEIVLREKDFK